jgi:hypothetical protein
MKAGTLGNRPQSSGVDSPSRPGYNQVVMKHSKSALVLFLLFSLQHVLAAPASMPLPEHPRPDHFRESWINLNGTWDFRFDPEDKGEREGWQNGSASFSEKILVPFSWGSPLSGVGDKADIGWYSRTVRVPREWDGKRVFLVIGASDWITTGWLDGKPLGSHRGGYTPFEFELTSLLTPGRDQRLVLRVDDTKQPFKLEGKQGYGPARGIWQTPYLEARGADPLAAVHFLPDIDRETVVVKAYLLAPAKEAVDFKVRFLNGAPRPSEAGQRFPQGAREVTFEVPLPRARLWSLEDPFLYEVEAATGAGAGEDRLRTYFGMRKISVEKLPGSGYPYIALNGKPVYLQMTLDQAYHPEGYYTFPSDEFMRDEILLSRRIGLNGMRVHVKIEIPRKLYWADRLGMLIMADVPNSWGQPDAEMRRETETALRGMIQRDFNHPSIFSWVIFNETWGLTNEERVFTEEAQEWVASMYHLAKSFDPTRLVEDNSPHRFDHVVTDINSWHAYLPGYQWSERLDEIVEKTFPGSTWNFIGGRTQGEQPLFNSECGNVWGYEGSTGDVDWSWDYHIMINEFRRRPKIAGWLYTEHHDVINEWNGYYRYDRSEKSTGIPELVEGMSLKDLHSLLYLSTGSDLCRDVQPGERVKVPLWLSAMTDGAGLSQDLVLQYELYGWDDLGLRETYLNSSRPVRLQSWQASELEPLEIEMPAKPALAVLALVLGDGKGAVYHRNFTTFLVSRGASPRDETRQAPGGPVRLLRFEPREFREADWTLKQWDVLDGLKVNGAGSGHFEYRIAVPADLDLRSVQSADFRAEFSAKQLFGKDRVSGAGIEGDFMRGEGTHDPSVNPNSYPMTDTSRFPSAVTVRFNGIAATVEDLENDSADHRGILSWHSQKRDRRLREAGSYGQLVTVPIPRQALEEAASSGEIIIRLEVDDSLPGGLAIYGARFGRYPLDPTLVFRLHD